MAAEDSTDEDGKVGFWAELRAVGTLSAMAFRAAPWRATLNAATIVTLSGLWIAQTVVLRDMVNAVTHQRWDAALRQAVVTALVIGAATAIRSVQASVSEPLEEAAALRVRTHIVELAAAPHGLEHHERADLQDRIDRLRNDTWRIPLALSNSLGFATLAVNMAGCIVLLFSVHPILLLLFAPVVVSRLITTRVVRITKAAEEANTEPGRRWNHLYWLCSSAQPGKEIRSFGLRPDIQRRQTTLRREMDGRTDAAELRATVLNALGSLPVNLAFVGGVAFALHLAVTGRASAGDVFVVIAQGSLVGEFIDALARNLRSMTEGLVTVDRYRWLIGYAAEAGAPPADPLPAPERLVDGIRLHGLSFRYHGKDRDALTDVDLHFPAGSTVAVVGDNGAGKTTLVKLLTGMYRPTAGCMEVDGIDLARIHPAEWRARCTAAFQDHTKWELVAREAIGLGDLDRMGDIDAVRAALADAGAEGLEAELGSEGLETPLGRSMGDGRELSGGQWQKLALARAMFRPRPLLVVLDEPTAALDPSAEHALFERYADLASRHDDGAVTILVSHRFSTVRMADLIVVVDDGGIAEYGTHEALMAAGGIYSELYELQARSYR
jgi:ATP-binding cassette subfamily B protein